MPAFSSVAPEPPRPITTPALAVVMVTVTRFGERSISTLLIAARLPSFFEIMRRTARSSAKYLAYSRLPTNHLLRQSLFTWRRMLIGFTFWPMLFLLLFYGFCRFFSLADFTVDNDANV